MRRLDGGPHLRKARESREGAEAAEREVARRGSRMAAASASSPSRAATLAGSRPSLYRRMITSMMVFQPARTLSPYLQAPAHDPEGLVIVAKQTSWCCSHLLAEDGFAAHSTFTDAHVGSMMSTMRGNARTWLQKAFCREVHPTQMSLQTMRGVLNGS